MSISLEAAERMYDLYYGGYEEPEPPDYNPAEEAMDRAIIEASMEEWDNEEEIN